MSSESTCIGEVSGTGRTMYHCPRIIVRKRHDKERDVINDQIGDCERNFRLFRFFMKFQIIQSAALIIKFYAYISYRAYVSNKEQFNHISNGNQLFGCRTYIIIDPKMNFVEDLLLSISEARIVLNGYKRLNKKLAFIHANNWNDFDLHMDNIKLGLSLNQDMFDLCYDFEDALENCYIGKECHQLQSMLEKKIKKFHFICVSNIEMLNGIEGIQHKRTIMQKWMKMKQNSEYIAFYCRHCHDLIENDMDFLYRKLQSANEWIPGMGMDDIKGSFNDARSRFDEIPDRKISEYKKLNNVVKKTVTEMNNLEYILHLLKE